MMSDTTREAIIDRIREKLLQATEHVLREYTKHVYACNDPVRCELEAWRQYYQAEEKKV